MKLYKSYPYFSSEVNIKSWLYTSSRNAALDYLRHLKVRDNNKLLMAEAMMYAADVDEVGRFVQSCGFWRAKARDIVASAQQLLERFGGKVPDNMEALLTLPGVGRKTANLILGDIYGQEGYVCDTHCIRITGRLGITDGSKDPLKVEKQLRCAIPPEESNNFCHRMVLHGRALCMARSPLCSECPLQPLCDFGKDQ